MAPDALSRDRCAGERDGRIAFHAAAEIANLRLIRLVEIVLVARRDYAAQPELWQEFISLAERHRIERYVYPVLVAARRLREDAIPSHVLERLAARTPWITRWVAGKLRPETTQQLHRKSLSSRLVWGMSGLFGGAGDIGRIGHLLVRGRLAP